MMSKMISSALLSQSLCQLYLPYQAFFVHKHY